MISGGDTVLKTFFHLLLASLIVLACSTAAAQNSITIELEVNASKYVTVGKKIIRMTSGNPSIARAKQVDKELQTGFLIEAHGAGTTSVLVWTDNVEPDEYRIVVSPEDTGLSRLIERAIGLPDVHVKKLGDRILLTGTVENQHERNHAIQVTSFYVGGASVVINTGSNVKLELDVDSTTSGSSDDMEANKTEATSTIVDLLQMRHPIQVKLEAQIIDINSANAKDLGFQYGQGSGSTNGITISPGNFSVGESILRRDGRDFRNNPVKWLDAHRANLNMTITALVEQRKARILSRPSIVTLSGEQATIQIGGEIPYSVAGALGTATVQFKDYGVILQFKPIVGPDDKITAAVHAEVSNLSGETVDGQPIIFTRRADAIVNLYSGTPMFIGGLMDSSETKSVTRIPLLSNIPILGEFFKYRSTSRDKRELIILIVPTVVESDDPVPMTEQMKDYYTEGKIESESREKVDLDEPTGSDKVDKPFSAPDKK